MAASVAASIVDLTPSEQSELEDLDVAQKLWSDLFVAETLSTRNPNLFSLADLQRFHRLMARRERYSELFASYLVTAEKAKALERQLTNVDKSLTPLALLLLSLALSLFVYIPLLLLPPRIAGVSELAAPVGFGFRLSEALCLGAAFHGLLALLARRTAEDGESVYRLDATRAIFHLINSVFAVAFLSLPDQNLPVVVFVVMAAHRSLLFVSANVYFCMLHISKTSGSTPFFFFQFFLLSLFAKMVVSFVTVADLSNRQYISVPDKLLVLIDLLAHLPLIVASIYLIRFVILQRPRFTSAVDGSLLPAYAIALFLITNPILFGISRFLVWNIPTKSSGTLYNINEAVAVGDTLTGVAAAILIQLAPTKLTETNTAKKSLQEIYAVLEQFDAELRNGQEPRLS